MNVVRVAIPLLKGRRRFFFSKGRPWSLFEHVLLAALANQPRTVADLALAADLPRRLVLEGIIRLMRAGWVLLEQKSGEVVFTATKAGRSVVGNEELPQISKDASRIMSFVIDKVTGTLYRSRELPFMEKHIVVQRAERERLVWLNPRELEAFDDTSSVLTALFEDDEKFLSIEQSAERMVERFAIATVRNDVVEGLPSRAPNELVELVKAAAKSAPDKPEGDRSAIVDPGPISIDAQIGTPRIMRAAFRHEDLILGGKRHEEILGEALRRSRRRLVVHSTFISESGFAAVRGKLIDAAKRGVVIDILWGEDEDKTDVVTTSKTVSKIRQEIESHDLGGNLRIHTFSTRSHAKILVFDDGRSERLNVVVGSCNWLASSFQSYEASVQFSDPQVVAAVLEQLADLARGADRHWTVLTSEFAALAVDARAMRPPAFGKADVRLVLGPQHAEFVRLARDEAKKRIFVTSHRLGAATRAAVIVPAIAAVRDRGLEVNVYYGTQSGTVKTSTAAALTATARRDGVQVNCVIEPRLHAKILAWDDDNLLLTSQNWLSADPSESNLRREMGLLIQTSAVARDVIENFEMTRQG